MSKEGCIIEEEGGIHTLYPIANEFVYKEPEVGHDELEFLSCAAPESMDGKRHAIDRHNDRHNPDSFTNESEEIT